MYVGVEGVTRTLLTIQPAKTLESHEFLILMSLLQFIDLTSQD